MRMRRLFVLLAAGALTCVLMAHAQDSQSLGDVARQSRLQKQQKDGQSKDASAPSNDGKRKPASGTDSAAKDAPQPKTPHVFTNDEIPEHVGPTTTLPSSSQHDDIPEMPTNAGNREARGEQWKHQIQSLKNSIASMEREITSLSESIHYAGANCVANCAHWNERQKEKQDRVETMKAQLEEQKRRLEEMQESARKQGFGSAVYDP